MEGNFTLMLRHMIRRHQVLRLHLPLVSKVYASQESQGWLVLSETEVTWEENWSISSVSSRCEFNVSKTENEKLERE